MHEESTFIFGTCAGCEDRCLGSHVPGAEPSCVHCGGRLGEIEWVSAQELVLRGYRLDGVQAKDGKKGCRSGACGVQQPAE